MIRSEELETAKGEIVHPANAREDAQCVLLAEDDPALRRYLEVVLERAGYKVASAADGVEAMKFLLNSRIDVVVTDAVMPNLDGYKLCKFMRSNKHLSKLPVILLSALDPRDTVHESEQADVFLAKPVSPEELLSRIEELSHKKAQS